MVVAYPSTPGSTSTSCGGRRCAPTDSRLILMQPKSLLRLPAAASRLEDLAEGRFQPVIDDAAVADRRDDVRRLVLCTAKMYYDLLAARQPGADVALVRVDELYPWPATRWRRSSTGYPEPRGRGVGPGRPKNMGAWSYVSPQLRVATGNMLTIRYIGRPERASPARVTRRRTRKNRRASWPRCLKPAPASAKRKTSKV
jgi:2-oxoglutarate dehydrogenase E1 component